MSFFFFDSSGNKRIVQPDCVTQHSDGHCYDRDGHQYQPQPDGIVEGTSGNDVIDYNYTGDPYGDKIAHDDQILSGAAMTGDLVYGCGGNDTVLAGEGNDIVNGGDGNDILNGGNGNDRLYGNAGNDIFTGCAGANVSCGGSGDDKFVGGAGADTFYGATGQDNIEYSASAAGVNINLTTGVLSGGDAANDHVGGNGGGAIGSNFADSLSTAATAMILLSVAWEIPSMAARASMTRWSWRPWVGPTSSMTRLTSRMARSNFWTHSAVWRAPWRLPILRGCCPALPPGFNPGAMIATDRGEVTVETLDHGLLELRWVGRHVLSVADLIVRPRLRPIRMTAGALGCQSGT